MPCRIRRFRGEPAPWNVPALRGRPGQAQFDQEGVLVDEGDAHKPVGAARRSKQLSAWSRRARWWRQLARPGTLVFGLIAAIEAAVLAAQAAGFPEKAIWHFHSAGWWANNSVAVVALILTAILAWRLGQSLSDRREELVLQQHCRSLWRYLTAEKELPPEHLGVHVWSLRDPRIWFLPHKVTGILLGDPFATPQGWRRFVPRAPFLQRRAVFTNERRVHPPMTFTRDRGVIGRCWRLGREIVENLEPLQEARTAAEFYEFSYDERYGLGWRQWWNTRHFCVIWAFPIFTGPVGSRRFAGCVSIDINSRGYFERLEEISAEKDDTLDSLLWDFVAVLRGDWRTI